MQQDEHVWTWRTWRFYMRGLYAGIAEIGLIPQERLGPEIEHAMHDNLWELYAR